MTVGTYLRGITGWSSQGNPIMLFLYVFFIVACVEEGFKYLCLRLYSYRLPVFDEPYDGIMYAVAVSLGFAAVENILYVAHYGLNTGLLRMFTAVPSHVVFAICMGYFVGKGKFIAPKPAFWQHAIGLLLAISAHALYDYFLFLHIGILGLVSIVLLYISIFFSRKALHLHAEISPHKDIEA
jgi:RsiW-degrading membrane proteinase PrsW (M82 family)